MGSDLGVRAGEGAGQERESQSQREQQVWQQTFTQKACRRRSVL